MALELQPPESDLWLPLPADPDQIDPHTIHTHYFAFSVPESNLGAIVYIRYQPAFPLSQGGVAIFRGLDNLELLDIDHLNWENTMRWPRVDGATITTAHGISVDFLEPGRVVRLRYDNPDASFDLVQTAITPLVVRPHVMPGEAEKSDPATLPGGSEQFMHCVGTLRVNGEHFDVDCLTTRDRSWNQVRTETRHAVEMPPIAWTPMCFGEDFSFNQIGWEAPETDPPYLAAYPVDPDGPTHAWGWVHADGRTNGLARVRREVQQRDPVTHLATHMTIDATDDDGRNFSFTGAAVALAPVPMWPNLSFHDGLFRWEDGHGRVAYASCQEVWFDRYQQLMNERAGKRVPATT